MAEMNIADVPESAQFQFLSADSCDIIALSQNRFREQIHD